MVRSRAAEQGSLLPLGEAHAGAHPPLPHTAPQVPCDASGAPLLALDGCALRLPEAPALGVLHLIRHPLELVISAYWFHSQVPAPEEWLENGEVGGTLLCICVCGEHHVLWPLECEGRSVRASARLRLRLWAELRCCTPAGRP